MRQIMGKIGRWLSPTALILVALCFLLPFATVACNTPGGYGHAAPGGTTTYSGVTLVVGAEPNVSPPEKVRPAESSKDDRLPPQPAAGMTLLLVLLGTGFALAAKQPRARRASVAILAAFAAVALVFSQAVVVGELAVRVAEQATKPFPEGKTAHDYVNTGPGFLLALLFLVTTAIGNAVAWLRVRSRAPSPTP